MWWARTFHPNRRGKGAETIPQYQRVSPLICCDCGALPFLRLWWCSSSQAFPITLTLHSFTPRILDSGLFLLPKFRSLVCCLCCFFHSKSFFCSFNNGAGFTLLPWLLFHSLEKLGNLPKVKQAVMNKTRTYVASTIGIVFRLGPTWWWLYSWYCFHTRTNVAVTCRVFI